MTCREGLNQIAANTLSYNSSHSDSSPRPPGARPRDSRSSPSTFCATALHIPDRQRVRYRRKRWLL